MKKIFTKNIGIIFFVLALVALQACSGDDSSSDTSEETEVNEQEYPSSVTIGTASQGGAYYLIGGGFSNLLEDIDVLANVEATGGPIHNLQLLGSGDADIGFTTTGPLTEAYTGEGDWVEEPLDDLRVAFPMYSTPFHWWSTEASGITNLEDLKDQRVGVGPSGGTSGTYAPILHEALGLNTDDVQAGIGDLGTQMLDRQLDTIGFAGGLPTPAATEVEAQAEITFFGIEGENRDEAMAELSYLEEYTISKDTYESIDEDIETVSMFNYGMVTKDTNEEFVYDLVKNYNESLEELQSVHVALKEAEELDTILKNEEYPMHPGAIRYYEEEGIDLPDAVYPDEWEEK